MLRKKKQKINDKLIVILGPTAAGKTALSIKLAKKFGGEVVSADSRQVYKGMDIGTAKPFKKMQNAKCKMQNCNSKLKIKPIIVDGIPHHLFDIIKPNQTFNVARYQKLAIKAIKNIQKREKIPFLVGGSPFYIYSVVEGFKFPKMKANLKLRKQLEKKNAQELFRMLKSLDPQRAKNIERKNKRRLIRAIEIAKTLGKVPEIQKKPPFDCLLLGIKLPKGELKQRISKRVDEMVKQGLEKEAKKLAKKYGFQAPGLAAVGYREWQTYFQSSLNSCDRKNKEMTKFKKELEEEVTEKIKLNTCQLAKHQMTWFRKASKEKPSTSYGVSKHIHWIKNYQEAKKLVSNFLDLSNKEG